MDSPIWHKSSASTTLHERAYSGSSTEVRPLCRFRFVTLMEGSLFIFQGNMDKFFQLISPAVHLLLRWAGAIFQVQVLRPASCWCTSQNICIYQVLWLIDCLFVNTFHVRKWQPEIRCSRCSLWKPLEIYQAYRVFSLPESFRGP